MSPKSKLLRLVALLGVTGALQLSCSSDGSEGDVTVRLVESMAATQTIGSDGGRIVAGDLQLDIPKNALVEDIEITMTPIASMSGSPLDEGFAAGAHFEPEGLSFLNAATLTMPLPQSKADEVIVGFGASGIGSDFHLAEHHVGTGTISLPVWHFSLAGTALAQLNDLELLFVIEPGPDHLLAEHRIALADAKFAAVELMGSDAEIAAAAVIHRTEVLTALTAWFTESVKPGFGVVGDAIPFYQFAMSDWLAWKAKIEAYASLVGDALDAEIASARSLAEAGGARIARWALGQCDGDDIDREVADIARIAQILAITGVDISKHTVDGTPGGRPMPNESSLLNACVSVSITDVEHTRRLLASADNAVTVHAQAEFWSGGVRSDVPLLMRHLKPATVAVPTQTLLSEEVVTNGRWELEVAAPTIPEDSFATTNLIFDVTLGEGIEQNTADLLRFSHLTTVNTFNRIEVMAKRAGDANYVFNLPEIAPSETVDLRVLLSGADDTGVQLAYSLDGSGSLSETAGTTNGLGGASLQYTASSDLSGRATVTAAVVGGGPSDSFAIEFGVPSEVEVIPGDVTLEPGANRQFTAEVDGVLSTDITWSATGGTITQDGLYTAGSTSGEFRVTATPNDRAGLGIAFVDIVGSAGPEMGVYLGTYVDTRLPGASERPARVSVNMTGPSTYLIGVSIGSFVTEGEFIPGAGGGTYNATLSGSQLTGESTIEHLVDGTFIRYDFEATVTDLRLEGSAQYYRNSDPDDMCGDGHCSYDFDVTWDRAVN